MNDNGYVLDPLSASDRRNVVFWAARNVALLGHRFLVTPHIEMDEEIRRIRGQEGTVFFYVGLHRSLWETSGAMVPLCYAGVPLPYVGMGDNLVHGRLFEALSRMIGTFSIKRPSSRKEILESARSLRREILGLLARGLDVLVYPEGTRKNMPVRGAYGDFFPAAFEPLLEYERNKLRICAENPGTRVYESYIVPFNVDYSQVREANEMVRPGSATPQTLNVFDLFSLLRHIGDTYLTYGRPVRVAELVGLDRKQLAAECRRRCLELVKILPVNVASLAMLELDREASAAVERIHEAVRRVVGLLGPHAHRFRGFAPDDAPGEILQRAGNRRLRFERFRPEDVPLYQLYAGYVRHLL